MLEITMQNNTIPRHKVSLVLLYRNPTLCSIFIKIPSIMINLYKIALHQLKLTVPKILLWYCFCFFHTLC